MRHTTSHDTWLSREPTEDPDAVVDQIRNSIIDTVRERITEMNTGPLVADLHDLTEQLDRAEREARA